MLRRTTANSRMLCRQVKPSQWLYCNLESVAHDGNEHRFQTVCRMLIVHNRKRVRLRLELPKRSQCHFLQKDFSLSIF